MKLEFVGQSARDVSHLAGTSSRLVNWYREPADGKHMLRSVLGMGLVAEIAGPAVRAMDEVSGKLYAVSGGKLWQVSANGDTVQIGSIDDDEETTISGNGGDVLVAANGKYWRWNGTTLQEPTQGNFSDIGSVTYVGSYTVLTERNGRQIEWSDPGDPDALPALNYAVAGALDDTILRAVGISGALWVFKTGSIEPWYLTGEAGANAFLPVTGGALEFGLKAFNLICPIPNGAFFVSSRGQAMALLGTASAVSTPAVEAAIEAQRPVSVLYYEDRGHGFCCIVMRDGPAWCYDLQTGEWHERAEGTDLAPWGARVSARLDGVWYVGRDGGAIAALARSNRDFTTPLKRVAVSRTLDNDGVRVRLAEVEVFGRFGFEACTVSLELSGDRGLTWGRERMVPMPEGAYAKRCIWRALGQFRQVTARISVTDAENITLESVGRAVVA